MQASQLKKPEETEKGPSKTSSKRPKRASLGIFSSSYERRRKTLVRPRITPPGGKIMRYIIAFNGPRGAGKTTSANYLCRHHGFKVVSFGSFLRSVAKEFFPFSVSDFSEVGKERKFKEYDWTPREFLIALGKMGRFFDEDLWVKKSGLDQLQGRIVVDDLRFPNEAKYLLSLGAKIVRINRYSNLNVYGEPLDDESEKALDNFDKFDYTIHECRNMTLNDLHKELRNMLSSVYPDGFMQ